MLITYINNKIISGLSWQANDTDQCFDDTVTQTSVSMTQTSVSNLTSRDAGTYNQVTISYKLIFKKLKNVITKWVILIDKWQCSNCRKKRWECEAVSAYYFLDCRDWKWGFRSDEVIWRSGGQVRVRRSGVLIPRAPSNSSFHVDKYCTRCLILNKYTYTD